MDNRQEAAFWSTIKVLSDADALPYMVVIGSWAEYLFSFYFDSNYIPNIRTRDVDFLYPNIRRPTRQIKLEQKMTEAGFKVVRDSITEAVKIFKEDLLEIEFLTRQIGSGREIVLDIPGIGMRGQSLRDVNMLSQYLMQLNIQKFLINVPEPAAFAIQKILIYPHRIPKSKKEKDIESVRNLLPHIIGSEQDLNTLKSILKQCNKKELSAIQSVCSEFSLDTPFIEL